MAVTSDAGATISGAGAAKDEVAATIEALVDYGCSRGLIAAADRVWAYNTVLEAIGATAPGPCSTWVRHAVFGPADGADARDFDLEGALAVLAESAVRLGAGQDTGSGRDRIAMRIMGALTPRPAEIARRYEQLEAAEGPRAATGFFYRLCCDAGYVRRSAIARNVIWSAPTRWGDLEITINLSKPEKDPREIAAAGARRDGAVYPACQLCIENEGYPGRAAGAAGGAHPARQNLRIIPIELGGEHWGLQYSPYAYFNEHCIAMSAAHRPMHIDRAALSCLLDFLDRVPHYFIGSNADLPIVGGSILSHDHFQGGAHEFPMMRAAVSERFALSGHPGIRAAVLRWPLSVLRLDATDRSALLDACVHVLDAWRRWSDEDAGIVARDADGTAHNTVTPIMRIVPGSDEKGARRYEAFLALRCNIASAAHPLGVFHPHERYHHIKKENIGLIEVMGLAILPPRLIDELDAVERHLLDAVERSPRPSGGGGRALGAALESDPLSAPHAAWARRLLADHPDLSAATARRIIRDGVGVVFGRVLEDAGVFKWDERGRSALRRFIDAL